MEKLFFKIRDKIFYLIIWAGVLVVTVMTVMTNSLLGDIIYFILPGLLRFSSFL